jgi:hypothetical protein
MISDHPRATSKNHPATVTIHASRFLGPVREGIAPPAAVATILQGDRWLLMRGQVRLLSLKLLSGPVGFQ